MIHEQDTCCTDGCDRPAYIQKYALCKPCYRRHWKARNLDKLESYNADRRIGTKPCARCDTLIAAVYTYCDPCRIEVRRNRKQNDVVVQCAHCGKDVQKRARDVKRFAASYCDKRCKGKAENPPAFRLQVVMVKASKPSKPRHWCMGYCAECHEPFVTNRSGGRYCRETCAKRAQRRTGKKARSTRIRNRDRVERIGHAKLALRDGWKCHICKRRVSRKSWSIDHLVPLSAGGTHTWDNVALAHHRCNTLRRDTGPAQLRLTA